MSEHGLAERLAKCSASAVNDVLGEMGCHGRVLPPRIRGLDPGARVAGEVFTISGHVDQTLSREETLLRWARVLSRVPGGRVLVCQPNTRDIALMGELSARALLVKHTRGYVVDGHCRDVEDVLQTGLPVFCELATPADIAGRWTYDSLGEPVTIGGVTVCRGDLIIGDRDGVVTIPKELAEETLARTEAVMSTESEMRQAILAGMDAEQAFLKFGRF